MLKKYLLVLVIFSAPLLPMELNNVSISELKEELAKYKRVVVTLAKQTPESIRASLPPSQKESEFRFQEAMQRQQSKLQNFRGMVSQYEVELAKRVDQ